jgi:hypothetical protein
MHNVPGLNCELVSCVCRDENSGAFGDGVRDGVSVGGGHAWQDAGVYDSQSDGVLDTEVRVNDAVWRATCAHSRCTAGVPHAPDVKVRIELSTYDETNSRSGITANVVLERGWRRRLRERTVRPDKVPVPRGRTHEAASCFDSVLQDVLGG